LVLFKEEFNRQKEEFNRKIGSLTNLFGEDFYITPPNGKPKEW
jgi:hypothetical protein